MSIPADITYPKAAMKSAWDKGKSVLDTANPKTKKTGLGEALADAQEAWEKIPFAKLDATQVKVASSAEAKRALDAADLAIKTEVEAAYKAIRNARLVAASVAGNKNFGDASKKAATAAEKALAQLVTRRGAFDNDDFEALVLKQVAKENKAYAAQQGQLSQVVLKLKGTQVGTATAGVWNRRELKIDGAKWSKGKGTDYIGQVLTVEARQAGDDHAVDNLSGQTNAPKAKFVNDLKVESVSGMKALLKP
jgi:hypothetical protein